MNINYFSKLNLLLPVLEGILNFKNLSEILYLKFGKYYLINERPELGIAKKMIHLIETSLFSD